MLASHTGTRRRLHITRGVGGDWGRGSDGLGAQGRKRFHRHWQLVRVPLEKFYLIWMGNQSFFVYRLGYQRNSYFFQKTTLHSWMALCTILFGGAAVSLNDTLKNIAGYLEAKMTSISSCPLHCRSSLCFSDSEFHGHYQETGTYTFLW